MGIPLRISPAFFLTSAIIGLLGSWSMPGAWMLLGVLIWMAVIFISILVHEYGHALLALAFGQQPEIELVAFGGLTIPRGPKISLPREFLVVIAGPFFSFLLYLFAFTLMQVVGSTILKQILGLTAFINLFWTGANLLPVMPLDGGQLLRIVFEAIFGIKGKRYSLVAGMILAVLIALAALYIGWIIVAILFALFAFQNFEMSRQAKGMSRDDERDEMRSQLEQAELFLIKGKTEEAKEHLLQIREQSKSGIIYTMASEYLAQIYFELGKKKEAYELLEPLEESISETSQCLLHELAYMFQNYKLVAKLSGECFKLAPSQEMAEHAALAFASVGDLKSTVGWLKAVVRYGPESLAELLKKPEFNALREHPEIDKLCSK